MEIKRYRKKILGKTFHQNVLAIWTMQKKKNMVLMFGHLMVKLNDVTKLYYN